MSAYLKFDVYESCNQRLNESASTMGRQLLDGLKRAFSGSSSDEAAVERFFGDKKKYFNELYTITPSLKSKLLVWAKQTPGAVCMKTSDIYEMMRAFKSIKVSGSYTSGRVNPNGNHHSHTHNYEYENVESIGHSIHSKASVYSGVNVITNATCPYILDAGGGMGYLLFFTFDSDEIKSVVVMTKNKFSTADGGLSFASLRQFNTVDKSEYKK